MRLLALALTLVLAACSGGGGGSYNPTVFPYESTPAAGSKPIKSVILATHNLGKPSRSYLEKHESHVDEMVADYLQKKGYELVDSATYEAAYQDAIRQFGNPYDFSNGQVNPVTQQKVLYDVFVKLRESGKVDGIIFTDLMERQVTFTVGIKHVARWDGVTRSPRMQGPGQGVPLDFNWAKLVDAVSLGIYIFDVNGQRLFYSIGGISLTESIDTKGTPKFARSRTILHSDEQIEEGIELAFHPFIPMKGYPGNK